MLEQNWHNFNELIHEGGYVMAAIFALSACIYTLAFRTWMIGQTAAMPAKYVKDGLLTLNELPQSSRYWATFKKSILSIGMDQSARVHYLDTKKAKFRRALSSQLSLLTTLAAAAPLLGLLGTLVGMIDTFEALASSRSGDTSSMVAGGISKALITTNAGLIVAIPAIIVSYLAKRKLQQALLVFTALQNALETTSGSKR